MCEACGWRELGKAVGKALAGRPAGLVERRREWLEAIRVTTDDDRHCTDHQKKVVRQILKESGAEEWRDVPKALDKTKWSDERRQKVKERRRLNRRLDRHGGF